MEEEKNKFSYTEAVRLRVDCTSTGTFVFMDGKFIDGIEALELSVPSASDLPKLKLQLDVRGIKVEEPPEYMIRKL